MASLGQLEEHALFILLMATIVVIFWASTWHLLEELVNSIHERHRISKVYIYSGFLILVFLVCAAYPKLLQRI
jgi:hypothetical protein